MRSKSYGFHRRLFLVYSGLLLTVVIASFVVFHSYSSRQQERIYINSFERELNAYIDRVDNAIANADRQLLQIKSNPELGIQFYKLTLVESASEEVRLHPEWKAQLREISDSVHGLDTQVYQRVTFYNKSGAYVSIGFNDPDVPASDVRRRLDDLMPFLYDDSFRLIRFPSVDLLQPERRPVLSLMRKISYSGIAHSFAEIQLADDFFANMATLAMPDADGDPVSRSLYVFGSDRAWFPVLNGYRGLSGDALPAEPDRSGQPGGPASAYTVKTRESLLFVQRSAVTGWSYAMALPRSPLNASLRGLSITIFLLGSAISAVGMLLIHWFTRRALGPLHQLRRAMAQVDPATLESGVPDALLRMKPRELAVEEIRAFHASFADMLLRLQQSRRETTTAREAELRARLLALQKQVDPHFLYNTLSLIGMLGFDQGDDQILELCSSLINMFKYITYGDSYAATFEEEAAHLRDYLRIMGIRYENKLVYAVEIPPEMGPLTVPKLFLQPLVENSLKHAFGEAQSHWEIRVRGTRTAAGWTLAIEDNGRGFAAATIERLEEQARALRENLPPEAGHGIMNTLARLIYLFDRRIHCEFGSGPLGGALLRISMNPDREGSVGHENRAG